MPFLPRLCGIPHLCGVVEVQIQIGSVQYQIEIIQLSPHADLFPRPSLGPTPCVHVELLLLATLVVPRVREILRMAKEIRNFPSGCSVPRFVLLCQWFTSVARGVVQPL